MGIFSVAEVVAYEESNASDISIGRRTGHNHRISYRDRRFRFRLDGICSCRKHSPTFQMFWLHFSSC